MNRCIRGLGSIAVLVVTFSACAAPEPVDTSAADLEAITGAVLNQHIEAMAAKDVDAIVADYSSDAVIITADGVFEGTSAIREFFDNMMGTLTPELLAAFELTNQTVNGEYAYMTWSIGSAVPLGTDTFHVVDGKIKMQTFAMHMAE
jgi:ketosteroid isomerase-like protein